MIFRSVSLILMRCFPALVSVTFLGGCHQSDLPLVAVSGKVTFDGGLCPAPGNVTFQPLEIPDGYPKRPASGQFDTDGLYEVNTFNEESGVLPGRYLVKVTCYGGAPDATKSDPWADVDYISSEYNPQELTIEQGSEAIVHHLDVPRRKK
jgi:hypothetical protein